MYTDNTTVKIVALHVVGGWVGGRSSVALWFDVVAWWSKRQTDSLKYVRVRIYHVS